MPSHLNYETCFGYRKSTSSLQRKIGYLRLVRTITWQRKDLCQCVIQSKSMRRVKVYEVSPSINKLSFVETNMRIKLCQVSISICFSSIYLHLSVSLHRKGTNTSYCSRMLAKNLSEGWAKKLRWMPKTIPMPFLARSIITYSPPLTRYALASLNEIK